MKKHSPTLSSIVIILMLSILYISPVYASGDLNYFAGTWSLKLWQVKNKNKEPDIVARWTVTPGLSSVSCFTGHVDINEQTFTRELMAYDAVKKLYIRTVVTDNGDYIELTTTGWVSDSLTWNGTQHYAKGTIQLKEEIVKVNDNEFKTDYFRLVNKVWVATQTESVKKIGQ